MTKGRITFIGLGLYNNKDISLKGLEEIKNSDRVYAEFYTGLLAGTDINKIQGTVGKPIEILSRDETEKGDKILKSAKKGKIAFLTAGDPMTATTHVDLRLRAIKSGIKTNIIHGSSIVTAVPGLLGLQNYKFGRTTTIAYPEKKYFPTSPYEIIRENKKIGLHTLVLLDIQADKNRYMTANEGIELLLRMEEKYRDNVFNKYTVICVVAQAGSDNPLIVAGAIKDLFDRDFGHPLHTIVIPGKLHFMEIEALQLLAQLPAQQGRKLQKL